MKWETYSKKVQIESRVMGRMAINHICPAALEYKAKLLKELSDNKAVFGNLEGCTAELEMVRTINSCIEEIHERVSAMTEARARANALTNAYEKAMAYYEVAESLYELRKPIDSLEEIVDNRLWPLPKYRELLFIN